MICKSFFITGLAVAFCVGLAKAQTPQPSAPPRSVIPLSTSVTNGNITFSWPLKPGKWELLERPAASASGGWNPVPETQYQTNGAQVTVTMSLPKQAQFYCVRRVPIMRPPPLPRTFPKPPPRPTNAPPQFKRPQN